MYAWRCSSIEVMDILHHKAFESSGRFILNPSLDRTVTHDSSLVFSCSSQTGTPINATLLITLTSAYVAFFTSLDMLSSLISELMSEHSASPLGATDDTDKPYRPSFGIAFHIDNIILFGNTPVGGLRQH